MPELIDLLAITGADRAGVLWLDEYEPAEVHPYAILDLGNDRPNRSFRWEPLADAIDLGVPGVVDIGGEASFGGRSGPLLVIALGSDGWRLLFVVADGRTPRPWLSGEERERAVHIAGRCAGMVLHGDLDAPSGIRGLSHQGEREASVSSFSILKDLEDARLPDKEQEQVTTRYVVTRLVGRVVDDGAVCSPYLPGQVDAARRELDKDPYKHAERRGWEAVLRALEAGDLAALADATLELAPYARAAGHRWSTAQLCSWAYDIAVASGNGGAAAAAARAMAAACRELSDDGAATRWARVCRSLMRTLDDGSA